MPRAIDLEERQQFRVLLNPVRQEIVRLLHLAGRPLPASTVARRLKLSPLAAKGHLEKLAGLGLVEVIRPGYDASDHMGTLYGPANVPDVADPYPFSYFKGEEWRTQREVRRLTAKYFTTEPDGIPGNDDTGTMSTWAVFSMMGLYPDCPGEPYYTLTSPVFDRVTIRLDPRFYGRDELVIQTRDNAPDNIYIRSMSLGGKPLRKYRISHEELLRGGTLTFDLSNEHR